MTVVNEVFNNIKLIKMNAWEDFFYKKIAVKRELEDKVLFSLTKMRVILLFFIYTTPKIIVCSVFMIYIL